ncbi:hypothetical protein PHYBLDRAFT_143794 [Phycomyces blakesleeanus NRRL 1555(-)]|uniref:Secreted protein n=1 Tax=Phycomyces blakesleeanus (strain ATCC 8743b / DSM 1359 / FGSC 10004 / NBRC 33097 / NRRL 1555) TaxID=763407 RepID=A0A163ASR8_PHYB8|nr:hypothetical protein PHYBLDRAFT_143794 [Phycomyces blakesleeanus NRRL 1555(-)]OAD75541.1 hypothetical protein PHYBLDRAFT_143794 [Phycomyces blakesleeanus NRRL 1555(-)]|eukprot:XP_018293581.1 hypothetical protein PHYBLDRAFT_143794 [Phycomyces blakesleeanus NRRL 1555(-)]
MQITEMTLLRLLFGMTDALLIEVCSSFDPSLPFTIIYSFHATSDGLRQEINNLFVQSVYLLLFVNNVYALRDYVRFIGMCISREMLICRSVGH